MTYVAFCSYLYISFQEVDVGMAADMGTLQRLPKIVGNDSLVREYAYSCAKIEPEEAKTVRLDACLLTLIFICSLNVQVVLCQVFFFPYMVYFGISIWRKNLFYQRIQ